jgi:hypothetical protein
MNAARSCITTDDRQHKNQGRKDGKGHPQHPNEQRDAGKVDHDCHDIRNVERSDQAPDKFSLFDECPSSNDLEQAA